MIFHSGMRANFVSLCLRASAVSCVSMSSVCTIQLLLFDCLRGKCFYLVIDHRVYLLSRRNLRLLVQMALFQAWSGGWEICFINRSSLLPRSSVDLLIFSKIARFKTCCSRIAQSNTQLWAELASGWSTSTWVFCAWLYRGCQVNRSRLRRCH